MNGGKFFGSPYLLQLWLKSHFTGRVREVPPTTIMRVKIPLAQTVKKFLKEWHIFFEDLYEKDVTWDIVGSEVPLYLAPMEDELDLVLIGDEVLVVYRCSRMMGHY